MASTDRRTRARELAMQAICQMDVQGISALEMLARFFAENDDDPEVRSLAEKWSKGVWGNMAECDALISAAAVKWELSRLNQVDRSILRLGAYQLKYCPDIPEKVVINEAIEMAKKYSAESSPAFVNGVMDAIFKKIKMDGLDKCEK
ncbi:MAG: transcription antitermination factor NusB [Planctomycetes bacterium GWF2_42_9]|nr:MAG: transcription antitermination factor NusB [Planctomycetes bacterium GWF2_42_9]HAL45438.1 transcription antitermination factor NusB [Phycisphaerales bacterium]